MAIDEFQRYQTVTRGTTVRHDTRGQDSRTIICLLLVCYEHIVEFIFTLCQLLVRLINAPADALWEQIYRSSGK